MTILRRLATVCFVLSLLSATAPAQQQSVSEEVARAKKAIEGIASYPPDIRTAILQICQKPDLIVELAKTKKLPDLQTYPDPIQKAATEIAQYPEIVEALNDHIETAKAVGRLYAQSSPEAGQVVDKIISDEEKDRQEHKEMWLKMLKDDPNALQELYEGLQTLKQAQANTGNLPVVLGADAGSNSVTLSGPPGGTLIDYFIDNAYRYPATAAWMIWYWRNHHCPPGPWPTSTGTVYKAGKSAAQTLNDLQELAAPQDLVDNPEILKERAKLMQEFPAPQKRLAEDKDRIHAIAARRNEFPNLAKQADLLAQRNPQHPVNQWRQSAAASPRRQKYIVTPSDLARPSEGKQPCSVGYATPSRDHHVSSGLYNHRNCWQELSGQGADGQVVPGGPVLRR